MPAMLRRPTGSVDKSNDRRFILLQYIVGESKEAGRERRIEWIEPNKPIGNLEGPQGFACIGQSDGKTPIIEVRIQRLTSLELGNGLVMTPLEGEHHPELGTRHGEIGIEAHGRMRQLVRAIQRFGFRESHHRRG